MKWPWVSRLAYDALVAERDRAITERESQLADLRAERDRLLDSMVRLARVEHGMTETPRAPRPEVPRMPGEVKEFIKGFASASLRRDMARQAYRAAAAGTPWSKILADLQPEEGGSDGA